MSRLKMIGVGLAAVLLAAECGMIPAEASALGSGGPPVTNSPGPEYSPGDVVFLCVNQVTEAVRVEVRTDVAGNCAANEVQLPVVVPSPYPVPSSSS